MSWSKDIQDWARSTFGKATPERALERTADEWQELISQPVRNVEEAADVVICLCGYAEACGVDLAAAVEAKMKKNRARRWVINGDGTGQHVKEPEPYCKWHGCPKSQCPEQL